MENNSIKDLFSIKNYTSPFGLLQASVYILFLSLLFLIGFNQVSPYVLNTKYLLLLLLFIPLSHSIIWLLIKLFKKIPNARRNKINIAFAIKINTEKSPTHSQVINNFRRNIKNIDKSNNFNIIELPEEIYFEDHIKAEKYINEEFINLLIWGDTEEGKIDNNNVTVYHLKFSYNFRIGAMSDDDFIKKKFVFLNNIQNSIKGRKWDVVEAQSLPTLRVVSENLTEVSLYITLRCLSTFGFIRLAYEYSEDLYKNLLNNKLKFPEYDRFKLMVRNTLLQLAEIMIVYHMNDSRDLNQSETYANRVLQIDNINLTAVSHLAVINWLKGDEKLAHQFASRARRIDPSNNINKFNDAFFALLREDFKKALSMYKKIDSIPIGTNILSVIEFIEKEYDQSNNIALLFAAGYLNSVFADSIRGKSLFKSFLLKVNNYKSQEKYKDLVIVADRLLKL